eukprot:SAG31_NODE_30147_length_384_cov_13.491228_2_plen_89_part_01
MYRCLITFLRVVPDKPVVVVVVVSAEPVLSLGSQPLRCDVLGHPAIRQRVAVGFEHRQSVSRSNPGPVRSVSQTERRRILNIYKKYYLE